MTKSSILRPWKSRTCLKSSISPYIQRRSLHDRWLQNQIFDEWSHTDVAAEIKAGKRKSMLSILEERGYVHQIAGGRDNLDNLLTAKRIGAYVGADPTAASLHVGHMIPMMALFWLYVHGYHTISLIGGATATIGDPTGRTTERARISYIDRKANVTHMHMQLKAIWEHVEELARKYGYHRNRSWHRQIQNNDVWLSKVAVTEMLRLMGGGLRMGSLLSRDSVKGRMSSQEGMSLAEFCYPVFQAWDWWQMYKSNNIQLQIGGADQFGNIITGIEAVKYVATTHPHQDFRITEDEQNWEPYGFTTPLLTTSSGEKFGKSAGNAIWLNQEMTTPFDLYAYMLSTSDADVERYLKLFTFMPMDKIHETISTHQQAPEKRTAQHLLAFDFVELAHGRTVAEEAADEHATRASQRRTINVRQHLDAAKAEAEAALIAQRKQYKLDPPELNMRLRKAAPIANARNSPVETVVLGKRFLEENTFSSVLFELGLVASRSEGFRLIASRGAYVGGHHSKDEGDLADNLSWRAITNNVKGNPLRHVYWEGDQGILVVRVGKWKVRVIRVHSEEEDGEEDLLVPEIDSQAVDSVDGIRSESKQEQANV